MKKFMVMAAGLMMAAVLGACAPTARNTGETSEHGTAPAGAAQQPEHPEKQQNIAAAGEQQVDEIDCQHPVFRKIDAGQAVDGSVDHGGGAAERQRSLRVCAVCG